jgi:hypothetical protein
MDSSMVENNFHMTLQSTQTLEYFPNNSGSSFTVKLGKTIKFPAKLYEVGLAQFYYTPALPPKDENGNYIKPEFKFFGKVTGDNQISVLQNTESGFTLQKTSDELSNFIQDLNEELKNRNYAIQIRMVVSAQSTKWSIMHQAKENEGFAIPSELATAMGFEKSTFVRGEHLAEWEYSESEFQDFPNDKTFEFSIYNLTPKTLVVEEPKAYTIHGLLESINKTLSTYKCKFTIDGSELEYTSTHLGLMVKLSPQISQYLGIALDKTFHTNSMRVEANPNLILYTAPAFMLILCSCASNQVFGPKVLPILRIMPIPETSTSKQMEYTFDPIQYVSLTDSEISEISIQLLDEQMRPIPDTTNPCTMILHFRQRPI